MTNVFGERFQPAVTESDRTRQGRSKKPLRLVIAHDGRVFVVRYEGRPGCFFGATAQEATDNLQGVRNARVD